MTITNEPSDNTVAITRDRKFFLELNAVDCLLNDASSACDWAESQLSQDEKSGVRNYFYPDCLELIGRIWEENSLHKRLNEFAWDWAEMKEIMGFKEYKRVMIPSSHDEWGPKSRDTWKDMWVITEANDGDSVIACDSKFGRLSFDSLNSVRESAIYLIEKHGHSSREELIDMFILKNFPMTVKSTLGFDAQILQNGAIASLPKTTLSLHPSVTDGEIVQNEPPIENGVLWLVNARVFSASNRTDIVMFDPAKTVRDDAGKAIAQAGYIDKSGKSYDF
jgi:hypothetical protein